MVALKTIGPNEDSRVMNSLNLRSDFAAIPAPSLDTIPVPSPDASKLSPIVTAPFRPTARPSAKPTTARPTIRPTAGLAAKPTARPTIRPTPGLLPPVPPDISEI